MTEDVFCALARRLGISVEAVFAMTMDEMWQLYHESVARTEWAEAQCRVLESMR